MAHTETNRFHRHPHRRRTVIIIGGDKGGVGKSFVARSTAGWLLANDYQVRGFDGDARNAHLARYYSKVMPVEQPALRETDGWTKMFTAFADNESENVLLVDMPGGIGDMVTQQKDRFRHVVTRLDLDVILVWVASDGEDSIWLLEHAQPLAPESRTLFTMNGYFGEKAADFGKWMGSKRRAAFLEAGGKEMLLPKLVDEPMAVIEKARCPFNGKERANFNVVDDIDFDMWWEAVDHALAPFKKMLERD